MARQRMKRKLADTHSRVRVLGLGPDGRHVYTKDPDARAGHRSATNGRSAGKFVGYEVHLVAQVPDIRWTNGVDRITFGDAVPQVVEAIAVAPAGSHRNRAVVPVILRLHDSRALEEVIGDRGYSFLDARSGYFPLQRAGIEMVFDLHQFQRGRRPFKTPDLLVDGQIFNRHMPPDLLGDCDANGELLPLPRPPRNSAQADRRAYEERFNRRARYALRRHSGPDDDGAVRWVCPFHSGHLRSRSFPKTMRYPHTVPLVAVEATKCCDGTFTTQAEELPLWQRCIFGTSAWAASYGRRNIVESVNAGFQQQFTSFKKGYTQVFTTTKVTLMTAFSAVGYNLDRARAWRRRVEADRNKPRQRARRRRGTYLDLLGETGPGLSRRPSSPKPQNEASSSANSGAPGPVPRRPDP